MQKWSRWVVGMGAAVGTGFAIAPVQASQVLPGDLLVVQLGDGTAPLTSAGTAIFIREFSTGGAAGQTIPIDTTGASAIVNSGSATSEGALTLSGDGKSVILAGYNAPAGTLSIASSTATAAPRSAGAINLSTGGYSFLGTTTKFSGNNIRSAVTDGASNIFGAGAQDGVILFPSTVVNSGTQVNNRIASIFNGNLYFDAGAGTRGVYAFSGIPTTGLPVAPTLIIDVTSSGSPYEFSISPDGLTAYVADDRASVAGGIQKWANSGGTWSLSYTLGTGVTNIGARGIAVDWTGASPIIYGTSAEAAANRLFSITDTGAASTATTLATAGTNTIFRGVELAPVPEPASLVLIGIGAATILRRRKR